MKKTILSLLVAATLLASCKKDDKVEPKDYGLKTSEADMLYDADSEIYKQQVYLKLGADEVVATGMIDTESWTDFNFMEGTTATDVTGWDIVLTPYTLNLGTEEEPYPYTVVGALIAEGVEVALIEYADSEVEADITQAFADLALADVESSTYSTEIDAIGYSWKAFSLETYTYTLKTNWFYVVKIGEDTYKLRFVGLYGATTVERIIKFEYQLMQ